MRLHGATKETGLNSLSFLYKIRTLEMAEVVNFMLCIFPIIRNLKKKFFFFFEGVKDENLGMIIWSLQGFPGPPRWC